MDKVKPVKSVRFGGHLANVIEEYEAGIDENYNIIVQQVEDPLLKSSHLNDLLKQLTSAVVLLNEKHKKFIHKVLRIKWVTREEEIIENYLKFLLELVTANPTHLSMILNSLICSFFPPSSVFRNMETCIPQQQIFGHVHSTLQKIFSLIPLSVTLVFPLLASNYPFMKKSLLELEWYVKNILYLSTYTPTLRMQILDLVVSKTLKLDTLCPRDAVERQLEEDEIVFEMETGSDMKKETFIDKLDVNMWTLLEFVRDICYEDNVLTSRANVFFEELLMVFDKALLPIHDCCHVQFIMFYICSFQSSFFLKFRDHLWKKATNPNTPVVIRQTVLSYLGSHLARGKYLSLENVLQTLNMMITWIHGYITERDGNFIGNLHATARHGSFYSACQALFYVLIFRHKNILAMPDGFEIMRGFQLEHIVTSRLNPLKYCINTVVHHFSSVMRQHQIVYCNTIIERNSRQMLPICGQNQNSVGVNPLDSFFPFDRYLLKSSKNVFDDLWQEWDGGVAQDDLDGGENDNEVMATSPVDVPEFLKNSFGEKSKGISSSFKLITPSPY